MTDSKRTRGKSSGTARELPLARAMIPFDRFVRTSVSSSALLLAATAAALIWANSPWAASYTALWEMEMSLDVGPYRIAEPLLEWVNEGLMAFFFFVVGLEIKREVLVGELSSLRNAALPVVAALGGMVVPALIYTGFNLGTEGAGGWGIPMATDIAFVLGVLTLLGDRVPASLKVFLTALAIADDIGAVLVIAVFYTSDISWGALLVAAGLILMLGVAGRLGLNYALFYGVFGVLVWLALFESGVHATIAGVLVAMTVPARSWINASEFLSWGRSLLDDFEGSCGGAGSVLSNARQQADVEELVAASARAESPMQFFQSRLDTWSSYAIVPLFALANAGVVLGGSLPEVLTSPVTLGVAAGLILGKQAGITLFAWLAVKSGLASLPSGVRWVHIYGAGWLAGMGFTMSLFITGLAFEGGPLSEAAKVGILGASILAGAVGWTILRLLSSSRA